MNLLLHEPLHILQIDEGPVLAEEAIASGVRKGHDTTSTHERVLNNFEPEFSIYPLGYLWQRFTYLKICSSKHAIRKCIVAM